MGWPARHAGLSITPASQPYGGEVTTRSTRPATSLSRLPRQRASPTRIWRRAGSGRAAGIGRWSARTATPPAGPAPANQEGLREWGDGQAWQGEACRGRRCQQIAPRDRVFYPANQPAMALIGTISEWTRSAWVDITGC